jgi:bifunctional non-homologous end joining protein LigD
MRRWMHRLGEPDKRLLVEEDVPEWTPPMLATLTKTCFSDADWLFERKLDGQRCLAFRDGPSIRLMSRNRILQNERYPELVRALRRHQPSRFVVDGEIVTMKGGLTSFGSLMPRMKARSPSEDLIIRVPVHLYLFDVLHLDGHDVSRLPLRRRKALLLEAFHYEDPVRFTPHRNEDGEAYLSEACRKQWEGLIAKRADSPYTPGRSADWLKFKCSNRQEFVIAGFTEPKGSRVGFGALLLGYYDNGDFRYAGKVGTGFDNALLEELRGRMEQLQRDTPPFSRDEPNGRSARWVEPRLVAEVGFTEWTRDRRLRHPHFIGLRPDKPPRKVVREIPVRP